MRFSAKSRSFYILDRSALGTFESVRAFTISFYSTSKSAMGRFDTESSFEVNLGFEFRRMGQYC